VTEGGGPPSSYLSKPFTKRGAESKGIDHCSSLKLGRLPSFGFDQSLSVTLRYPCHGNGVKINEPMIIPTCSLSQKPPFCPAMYIRMIAFKANTMRPEKLVTKFFPDVEALLILYTLNSGPYCCLRAGGDESALACSKRGFEALYICSGCRLKIALVSEPIAHCLQDVTATWR
jgi:hypothetical protein